MTQRANRCHPADPAVRPIRCGRCLAFGACRRSSTAPHLHVDPTDPLARRAADTPWRDVMGALQQVRAVNLTIGEETYRIRTDLAGHAPGGPSGRGSEAADPGSPDPGVVVV
jgi:hypothetical protein